MSDVACRALEVFFEDAGRRGIPPEEFARGVDVTVAELRDRRHRIPWARFVDVLKNIGRYYSPAELEQLGGAFLRSPIIRPFAIVASLLFTEREFYEWVYSPSTPLHSVFSCVVSDCIARSDTEVVVTLSLRPGLSGSEEFNLICKGVVVDLPRLVAKPPATVAVESLPTGARYVVRFSGRRAPLRWLRKLVTWPFTIFSAGRALKSAHEGLRERYFELDAAKQVVAAQATQLETAHAISQVVHSDTDLVQTVVAVAQAFVTIGQFAGAHVMVEGTPVHEARSGSTAGDPQLVRTLEAGAAEIGHVSVWFNAQADATEREQLFERVCPTVELALHGARAYSELLAAQQHLEERVRSRTAELVTARDTLRETVARLESATSARARIFANINHEIRTPLTLILLSTDELQRHGRLDAQDAHGIAAVRRNARKLLRLVDGLLILAAGDEGKLTLAIRPVDLAALVVDVVDGFAASARACGINLRAEAPATLEVEVDENAVDRIISNLLSNAIKFTPAGGEIVVTLTERGSEVELTVRDSGIGISEEFIPRVFGRFEQDGRPVRPGTSGSGIGLSIVRDLAQAHRGSASVERLAVGTMFRVRLPQRASQDVRISTAEVARVRPALPSDFGLPTGAEEKEAAPVLRAAQTVLVVEDDHELRARVVELLSTRYRVLDAADGETALVIAAEQRPDALVSDIGLPGIDGLELAKRFHTLPGNRLAPVLLLTAFVALEHRLSGFEAGAVDYLTKPFEPSELVARLRAQLDRRDLALRLHESEKLAAIGNMSAGLAHEMRNPANGLVNAISPLVELLPPEMLAPGNPVAELLDIIRSCGTQIGLLSRQLLGARRGAEILREEVDAAQLVERSVAIAQPTLRDLDVRVDLRYHGTVSCAPALVMQILSNLLDNAAYAARQARRGGGDAWISVATYAEQDRFICEVADSGPGVPPALREQIFDPFFTTKAPGEGTGLGLSTSRQIAERHGGTLYVLAAGDRCAFRWELPLAQAAAPDAIALG